MRPDFIFRLARLACLGLSLPCAAALAGETGATVRFSLDRPIDGASAPFVLAQDKGLYRARSLDVETAIVKGSPEAIERTASGDSDLALADLNALIRYRDAPNAAPVKAVFVLYGRAPYAIVARRSRGIADLTDIAGKTLGVADGDLAIRMWPALAQHAGIDAGKVRIERIGAALREPMLSAGQVDAVSGLSFASALNLKDRGVPASDLIVFRFADHGSPAYGSAVIVNPAFAEARPDAVRNFVLAVIEGVRTAAGNPAGATEAVLARLDGGARDLELERLKSVLHDNVLTEEVRRDGIGAVTPERFEASLDAIAADHRFRRRPALADIFDDAFLPPPSARRLDLR